MMHLWDYPSHSQGFHMISWHVPCQPPSFPSSLLALPLALPELWPSPWTCPRWPWSELAHHWSTPLHVFMFMQNRMLALQSVSVSRTLPNSLMILSDCSPITLSFSWVDLVVLARSLMSLPKVLPCLLKHEVSLEQQGQFVALKEHCSKLVNRLLWLHYLRLNPQHIPWLGSVHPIDAFDSPMTR